MDTTLATVLILTSNLTSIAATIVNSWVRTRHLYDRLDTQDAIVQRVGQRVDSVGRHADVRYVEMRIGVGGPTPEQTRLHHKHTRRPAP